MVLAILSMLGAAAVSIAVAFIIGSAVLPTGVESMVQVDTANWSAPAANLWNQIPTFGIIALAVGFLAVPLAMIMMR